MVLKNLTILTGLESVRKGEEMNLIIHKNKVFFLNVNVKARINGFLGRGQARAEQNAI